MINELQKRVDDLQKFSWVCTGMAFISLILSFLDELFYAFLGLFIFLSVAGIIGSTYYVKLGWKELRRKWEIKKLKEKA